MWFSSGKENEKEKRYAGNRARICFAYNSEAVLLEGVSKNSLKLSTYCTYDAVLNLEIQRCSRPGLVS